MQKNTKYAPGTTLIVDRGLIDHYGIVVRDGHVAHKTMRHGKSVIEPLDVFAKNRNVRVSNISSASPEQAAANAEQLLGERYDPFSSNCEHYARKCHGLPCESHQVQKAAALAIAGATLASKNCPSELKVGTTVFATGMLCAKETEEMQSHAMKCLLVGSIAAVLFSLTKS